GAGGRAAPWLRRLGHVHAPAGPGARVVPPGSRPRAARPGEERAAPGVAERLRAGGGTRRLARGREARAACGRRQLARLPGGDRVGRARTCAAWAARARRPDGRPRPPTRAPPAVRRAARL